MQVCGDPLATAFAITSDSVNMFAVSDQMEEKGISRHITVVIAIDYILPGRVNFKLANHT